jgi:tetratricopeptide (TPR) repeat protein
MRDPTRIRDFGTAGSLLLDSMSILAHMLGHRGHFDRAFAILERARAIPQKNAFDIGVVNAHHARVHLFRGDAELAEPMCRAAIEHASLAGLEFMVPWLQALLGYALGLAGDFDNAVPLLETALERSQQIQLPYLTSSTGARLGETLASRQPKRALEVAVTALGVARASGHRALEAELLRVKAASLLSLDRDAAEVAAQQGYELAQRLDLGPEQGHGLRTLGDILAVKGEAAKAGERHNLARAKYRSLGMTRWVEAPWREDQKSSD